MACIAPLDSLGSTALWRTVYWMPFVDWLFVGRLPLAPVNRPAAVLPQLFASLNNCTYGATALATARTTARATARPFSDGPFTAL